MALFELLHCFLKSGQGSFNFFGFFSEECGALSKEFYWGVADIGLPLVEEVLKAAGRRGEGLILQLARSGRRFFSFCIVF